MENPEVKVTPITSERDKLITTNSPTPPDLGGEHDVRAAIVETQIGAITRAMRQQGGPVFELSWIGKKVPRGAQVAGNTIAWTQNGRVLTKEGTDIGSYERTVEFGGLKSNEQKMIVYVHPHAVKTDLQL